MQFYFCRFTIKIMNSKLKQDVKELIEMRARARNVWDDVYADIDFDRIANIAADDMARGASQCKICLRLFGQSGSGKSTQLLPMAMEYCKIAGITPVHITMGNFVKYFPGLDELTARIGKDNVREATNAFVLLLVLGAIEKLAERGTALVMDLAILEPMVEEYIIRCLSGYETRLYGIVTSREISDANIEKRMGETGRRVNDSSAEYFWKVYGPGFATWREKMPDAKCVLFSVCDAAPVFDGAAADSATVFEKYRTYECAQLPAEVLLNGKLEFIKAQVAI